jgi:hypothetical protein
VSLTVDRKAINDAESGGMGRVSGNWINDDVEYALDWPQWETNIPKAKGANEAGRAAAYRKCSPKPCGWGSAAIGRIWPVARLSGKLHNARRIVGIFYIFRASVHSG